MALRLLVPTPTSKRLIGHARDLSSFTAPTVWTCPQAITEAYVRGIVNHTKM